MITTFSRPTGGESPEVLAEMVARLQKQVEFLFNGNISTKNVREVGGWLADDDRFVSIDGDVGMSSVETGGDDVRFWAGSTLPEVAPFQVLKSGKMKATDGEFTGSITGASIIGSTITGGDINVTSDLNVGNKIIMNGDGLLSRQIWFGNEFTSIRSSPLGGGVSTLDLVAFGGITSNGGEIATQDWVNSRLSSGTVTISSHNHGIGSGTSLDVTGGGSATFVSSGGGTYSLSF